MASKVSASNLPVYSRFAVLEEDSCNSSEEEKEKEEGKNGDAKKLSKSAKKRARKKKKTASEAAESEQLRNMAFRAKPLIKANHPIAALPTSSVTTTEEKPAELHDDCDDVMSWENWRERDEKFVMDQFQRDLERAMKQSVEDAKQQQKKIEEMIAKEQMSKASPKKEQPVKMSLLEFQTMPSSNDSQQISELDSFSNNWICEDDLVHDEELPNGTCDVNNIEDDNISSAKKEKKKKKKRKPITHSMPDDFLEECLHNGENDQVKPEETYDLDPASIAQWKYEVEKKDKIIGKMNRNMELMKTELSQVKKRNKQLCFILGQGEMKDKSDLLQQIEELIGVKDELSAELSEMHSALEQERSKVSALKQELAKHQNSRGKRHSTSES